MKSTELKTFRLIKSVEKNLLKVIGKGCGNSILVAFSAGPDSTALLDILAVLREKHNLKVAAAYFNHCLRKESELEKEKEIVAGTCAERNITVFIGEDSNGEIVKAARYSGIEAAARKIRYMYLKKTAEDNGYNFIATAHNLDDNIETLIMRFFTGSGPEGLKGIAAVSGNIIRPMLNITKREILDYLLEKEIVYSVDSSNSEGKYLRNRVRNEIVPVLKSVFPGMEKSLSDLAEKMYHVDSFISEETQSRVMWEKNSDSLVTDLRNFMDLPACLKLKAVYSAHDAVSSDNERLSFDLLKPLFAIQKDKKSPVFLESGRYRLEKEGKSLLWKTDIVIGNKNSYLLDIKIGNEYKLPNKDPVTGQDIFISACLADISDCGKDDIWLPADKVSGSILVRNRAAGDFINIKAGNKSLKKLFQEMGIKRELRNIVPVIADNNEIMAVWGSILGYRDRIAEKFREKQTGKKINVIIFKSRRE